MAKVKVPKKVAGVKIPKKVRKTAKKALQLADNPIPKLARMKPSTALSNRASTNSRPRPMMPPGSA